MSASRSSTSAAALALPPASPATESPPTGTRSVPRKRHSDHGRPDDAKRRRRHVDGFVATEELLKPAIVVRAHPPNPAAKPCTLLPLMLLPREHLPLASLDLASPHGDLPTGRQFQSHIRILDLEGRLGSDLLIASSGGSGTMYAIERDQPGLYALCKLGSWADIRALSQKATAVCRERMPSPAAAPPPLSASTAEPALVTPHVHKEQRQRRLAIAELQSIVRRRPASQATPDALLDTSSTQPAEVTSSQPLPAGQPPPPPPPEAKAQPLALPPEIGKDCTSTAEDIFQHIRNQYLEALYHSMGSLAYFAKGPLSRARAAFHLDCDGNLEMDDLIEFLKSLVLTTTMIDKKYRETIPTLTERLRMLGDVSETEEGKRRPKKAKKMRLGSSGLYTAEDSHVRSWWQANKPALHDDEVVPRPAEVRYAISSLRTRETQLQMILILEILALDTMRPAAGDAGESQLPGMENTPPAKKEPPPAKKRSKHNLPLLIDVHADRLCIWQSTTTDDVQALAESQTQTEDAQGAQSDRLKDFCVDIIVPFFSARLPLVCDALNRKLGGPVIAPPARTRPHHSSPSTKRPRDRSAAKQRAKPGAAARRPTAPGTSARRPTAPGTSARSLERVLSNERLRRSVSRGPNDAIAQMRSAMAAPIPGLKREMSEPASLSLSLSLAGIPRQQQHHARHSSTASLKERPANMLVRSASDAAASSSNNDDNNNDSGGGDDRRARQKALVEAELQEAISALKKPNRELAGKATVEAAERRLSVVRKPKKSRPAERVQVKATPVSQRFRDVFAEPQGHGGGGSQMHAPVPQFVVPPSSHSRIAASPRVVTATPLARKQIQMTPVRASTTTTAIGFGMDVPDSALKSTGAAAVPPTPPPAPPPAFLPPAYADDMVLASSPLQTRSAGPARTLFATPIKAKRPAGGVQSLYQQIGWDDVDELQ